MKTYFLNFIEEAVLNPDFAGCIGGRAEVYEIGSLIYPISEIRFLTRKITEFEKFCDRWDGEIVNRQQLGRLALEIQMYYRDGVGSKAI
jgi:hypothetical protein